jgi:2-methylisocitrate lyase-like PEP mutase family enzyme
VTDQERKAAAFRELHAGQTPLVLANVWDVASAVVVASLPDCKAIATGSAGVAAALGYVDGERIPAAEMLEAVRRIAAAVELPVTADLEAGYGEPGATARGAWEAGVVGMNLEDGDGTADEHVERVREARAAAPSLWINARVDLYLAGRADLEEAVARAEAYIAAGADSIFVPGVVEAETIGRLAAGISAPLNVLATAATPPVAELGRLGVARVSVGAGLMRVAAAETRRAAAEILSGDLGPLSGAMSSRELTALLERR